MNFRSQRGATGTDIIIAITIIVFTVAVVSMIYVNTTLQSRNVTRTAGATRIATNMLENMEKMTYAQFDAAYQSADWIAVTSGEYNGYKSVTDKTVFNTKIPKGYTVYLKAEPNYGSHSASTKQAEQFDLVREIKLAVTYKVGDVIEKVDFNTSKTREIVEEVNPPNTDVLYSQNIINSTNGRKFYPVKYVDDAKAYVKTTTDDSEWYNYAAKKWAMVIISTKDEGQLFDVNGKLVAPQKDASNNSNYVKYTWIPKYFYTGSSGSEKIAEFAYQASDELAIKADQVLNSQGTPAAATLHYNTIGTKASGESVPTTFVIATNKKLPGKWVDVTSLSGIVTGDTGNSDCTLLNTSMYGPCNFH